MPSADTHLLNRESSIVRGSFRKVLSNSRLLKLNFGIMCLHILLMSSFVALPLAMEKPGWRPASMDRLHGHHAGIVCRRGAFHHLCRKISPHEAGLYGLRGGAVLRRSAAVALRRAPVGHHRRRAAVLYGLQRDGSHSAFADQQRIAGRLQGHRDGVYSTSQFIGVAIGGSLGGWLYGLQGRARCLSPAPCWPRFGSRSAAP